MNLKFLVLFSALLIFVSSGTVFAQTDSNVSVAVSSDKTSYLFGETAVIQGSVSQEVFIMKPTFIPQKILINISGNSFEKAITLYPDSNLRFKITQNLQQVLGITGGDYVVSVQYGDAVSQTTFSVGHEIIVDDTIEARTLTVTTDKEQYLPGSTVKITAEANFVIPYSEIYSPTHKPGMYFQISDPNEKTLFSGNLFPTDGKFFTDIFISTLNPVYGTYEILTEYSDQTTLFTFELVEDIKEDKIISLWTDKEVYGLGETVTITGRLNHLWIQSVDIEILQTKNLALKTSVGDGGSIFKILDAININGDGTFDYSFVIPDGNGRLGDYTIKISKEIGTEIKSIVVVENPDTYVSSTDFFSVSLDSEIYSIGDTLVLTGKIANPVTKSEFYVDSVSLSIVDEFGAFLNIIGHEKGKKSQTTGSIDVVETFTSIPDTSGYFSFEISITRAQFEVGNYEIQLNYGVLERSVTFSVTDPVDVTVMTLSLDRDVYGLGDVVTLTGLMPPLGEPAISISLTNPDGNVFNSGTHSDNQQFSWTWMTPVSEKVSTVTTTRSTVASTNFGIYKINVNTSGLSQDLFFKVSADPENDFLSKIPLSVTSDKSLYSAGDTLNIIGNTLPRSSDGDGLIIPQRVVLTVQDGQFPYDIIFESAVYSKSSGVFETSFDLPVTVFPTGEYKINAMYNGITTKSIFSVVNDFTFGIDEDVTLLISTDKSQYNPGDVVTVSGKPNKLIYLDKFDVSVIQKSDTEVTCGSFICGVHQGPTTSILPSHSGSFEYQFVIDNSDSSLGLYEIIVDADFETKSIQFNVIPTPKLDTIIEKQNRIPEKEILIFTEEKTLQNTSVSPRVLSGSLITPSRGDESNVNLRVTSESGVCIIGPDADCLVSESTRAPGQIYDVVEVDGLSLNVRYSGPDARLEKFSILPESSTAFLPDVNWNIEVLKDEQISRFYYKVTYKTLE